MCVCVCEHGCIGLHCVFNVHVYIYKPVCVFACLYVCMCWNTSISHPTSNQWCQPFFDACSTVTKPYCTLTTVLHKSQRDRGKNLHLLFSLTSDTFFQFLAHKKNAFHPFVPCFKDHLCTVDQK